MDNTVLAAATNGASQGLILSWEITIGQILTTLITLVGVAWAAMSFFAAMKNSIAMQARLAEASMTSVNEKLGTLGGRVMNVETELREINRTMSAIAVQSERLSGLERRIEDSEKRVVELRGWCSDMFRQRERDSD